MKKTKKIIKSKTKPKLIKYDLGCGQRKQEGHIGVDIAKTKEADIVWDLTKFPYKWAPANEADEIYTSHFVEHLDGPQRVKFIEECFRMLKVGGKLTVIVPYYNSMRAVQDPTHKWPPVAESSFLYFNKQWLLDNKLDHYDIHCDFDFTYGYILEGALGVRNPEYQAFAVKHYTNSVLDLMVTLTKK